MRVNDRPLRLGGRLRWFKERLVVRLLKLGPRQHVLLVSFVVGVLCGLAAVLLKNAVHWTRDLVNTYIVTDLQSLWLLLLPGIGILLTSLYVRYVVHDDIAHGVSTILYAISRGKSQLKFHNTYSSIVASSVTIGFGGSVGAEAPIVLTGAAIGSNVGRFFGVDIKTLTLMLGCGAAAGIAAIFKAPLAGMVFTLEVMMLDLTMNSIVPLLISAVSATMVSYFLLGNAALFHFTYTVPFDLAKTPYYLILGVVMGFASLYFTRAAMWVEKKFSDERRLYRRFLAGAAMLGVMIYLFPPLYGEGYDSIQDLFSGQPEQLFAHSPLEPLMGNAWLALLALGALAAVKVFAMAATTGAGGVGGSFAPTLFLGGVGGYTLAQVLNLGLNAGVGVENFVLVGMAGAMAGVMHAPLLGIFLIAELTEGYVLLMPLMMTATVSYITIMRFENHSIYTKRLAARGDLITHPKDRAVLTMLELCKVIETDLETVHPQASLGELVKVVARSHRNIFPVVNDDGVLLGIVLLDDIRSAMFDADKYESYSVRDFMTIPPAVIDVGETMNAVMGKFEATNAWNLPVVDSKRYVGFVSKAKIFSAYRATLQHFSNE